MLLKDLKIKLPPVDPVNFVAKICSEADLSKKVMLESKTIIRFAQKERLTAGKDPTAVAAAATHYACTLLDIEITQQEIANAAGLSEITIRNLSRGLKNALELEKATKHEIEESITCR